MEHRMISPDIVRKNVERLMASRHSCNTQQKLAERSGVGKTTIGRLLRSEAILRVDTLEAIAAALNVEPYELLIDPDASKEERARPLSSDEALDLIAPFVSDWKEDDFLELIGALKAYRKLRS